MEAGQTSEAVHDGPGHTASSASRQGTGIVDETMNECHPERSEGPGWEVARRTIIAPPLTQVPRYARDDSRCSRPPGTIGVTDAFRRGNAHLSSFPAHRSRRVCGHSGPGADGTDHRKAGRAR